ncbi:MAG: DsbA family protein [Tepidiformaceae bacterium]
MTEPATNKILEGEREAGETGANEELRTPMPGDGVQRVLLNRRQPLWSYFLTPAAILVGAVIIAGSIWWTGREDEPETAAPAGGDSGVSEAPTLGGAEGSNLAAVLTRYAGDLGLDTDEFAECINDESNVGILNTHVQRGRAAGVTGTPTFFINNKKIVGAQPQSVFDEVIEAELNGSPTSLDGYSATIQQLAAAGRFAIVEGEVDVSDADIEGERDAEVVIAEFSDFQCPFCERWVAQSMENIRARAGDDVALAFLHFPIQQIHPNAPYAHVASVCAEKQGDFWGMHDVLFARQNEWAQLPR